MQELERLEGFTKEYEALVRKYRLRIAAPDDAYIFEYDLSKPIISGALDSLFGIALKNISRKQIDASVGGKDYHYENGGYILIKDRNI